MQIRNWIRVIAVIGVTLILCTSFIYYPRWKNTKTEATISWDVSGYYLYLPAIIIYQDLKKVSFLENIIEKYQPTPDPQQVFTHPSGNRVMKYSSGQAILFLPFFISGHFAAKLFNYPQDGFSKPYQFAMQVGSIIYMLLGCWILFCFLRRVFHIVQGSIEDLLAVLTVFLIVFATNFLNYGAIDGCMTHNTLFMLYALLLYVTETWHRNEQRKYLYWIGGICGLMTLIRPTEIVSLAIPLLWHLQVGSSLSLLSKWYRVKKHFKDILIAMLIGVFMMSIQCFYWKYVSGEWIVYSYQNQGFSWLHPHLHEFFKGPVSGWFIYTPIVLVAFLGIYFLWRERWHSVFAITVFLIVFLYIAAAWDEWHYGGSLSQRAAVQSYPIIAIGIFAITRKAWTYTISARWAWGLWSLLFCYYNVWLTHQAHRGGLYPVAQVSTTYLKNVLGRYSIHPSERILLEAKEMYLGKVNSSQLIFQEHFEQETLSGITPIRGTGSLVMQPRDSRSPEYKFPLQRMEDHWLRASVLCRVEKKEHQVWEMMQMVVRFYFEGKVIKENMMRMDRFLEDGKLYHMKFDTKIPDIICDQVSVLFWNPGGESPMVIDELEVRIFKE